MGKKRVWALSLSVVYLVRVFLMWGICVFLASQIAMLSIIGQVNPRENEYLAAPSEENPIKLTPQNYL